MLAGTGQRLQMSKQSFITRQHSQLWTQNISTHAPQTVSKIICHSTCTCPTRHAGSKSHKGNCIDTVFQIDKTAEMTSNVSNQGGVTTNGQDTDHKGWISIHDCYNSVESGVIIILKKMILASSDKDGKAWHLFRQHWLSPAQCLNICFSSRKYFLGGKGKITFLIVLCKDLMLNKWWWWWTLMILLDFDSFVLPCWGRIKFVLTSWWNESKEQFPWQSEEVHDVVSAGWHLLLSLLAFLSLFIII